MSKTIIVKSSFAGYGVVDCCACRVLQRYGQVLVDSCYGSVGAVRAGRMVAGLALSLACQNISTSLTK